MKERVPDHLVGPIDEPAVAVLNEVDGHLVVRYYRSEGEADADLTDADVEAALATCGAWSDLDWNEVERELDRIRHASPPTPPIDRL